ncbi:MAG TPA: hypothetical protein VFE55_19495 [Acidimicrobiia bacterium]|nr:hypothetical protein [Acidimicrobiia bacterium]
MTEALTGVDRSTLLAERAEAEAQMRAAEATLGLTPPVANGQPGAREEGGKAVEKSPAVEADGMKPDAVGALTIADVPELDLAELRRAAASARAADDVLARAAFEAAERPPPAVGQLGTAESAFAEAAEIQEDLPAAWRRLVGALISATGMAIVIGALGWNTYWLLVPIALIAIMTVDLRLSGRAAREASAQAAKELAMVGVAGSDGLERVRQERARMEDAESRLAAARASRDAAYARFAELAPGRTPSELDDIIAEHEARLAARAEADARAARAEADAARAEADTGRIEPDAGRAEAPEPAAAAEPAGPERPEPVPQPAISTEWWFGSQTPPAPPVTAPAAPPPPVRALAERLSAEGRAALARIEAQLAALDRLELAKRSLEWHESRAGDGKPQRSSPSKADEDAEDAEDAEA